jgi:hypothetical protein
MATPTPTPNQSKTPRRIEPELEPKATLSIPASLLGFLVAKAREFDAEVPPSGSEDGSDMTDDRAVAALEDTADNPTREELTGALRDMNQDQRQELLALVLIGRGDFSADEWEGAIAQARELGDARSVQYLVETPLLGDLLEDGLDELGYNITEEEGRT